MDAEKYLGRARAKITAYGMDVTFYMPPMAYDPLTGAYDSAQLAGLEAKAVMLGASRDDLANGLCETGDAKLLVAGDSFGGAPNSTWLVAIKGEKWRVVGAQAVAHNGVPLLWKIFIRRS